MIKIETRRGGQVTTRTIAPPRNRGTEETLGVPTNVHVILERFIKGVQFK